MQKSETRPGTAEAAGESHMMRYGNTPVIGQPGGRKKEEKN